MRTSPIPMSGGFRPGPTDGEYRSTPVFTGNGTWTKPAGLKRVRVTVVGGGGGSAGTSACGAGDVQVTHGGAAGGVSIKTIEAASLGATETVTVGAAGTAGTTAPTNGGNGGTTSFGAHCSATGGNGSSTMGPLAPPFIDANTQPSPGVGSGGDINLSGEYGKHGIALAVSTSCKGGDGGGILPYGSGGRGNIASGAGQNGANALGHGGGASGACTIQSSAGRNGGAGTAGIVIVEEFF